MSTVWPRIVAASLIAAFTTMHEQTPAPESMSKEEAVAKLDEVIDFARGGLEALRRSAAHRA